MKRSLVSELLCPYCNGRMDIVKDVAGNAEELRYGLLRCRCFEFPVVEGILLLSLAKGYGGAEEALQPYVPLQVASIDHLRRGDVAGLRSWIRRHLPLAAELMDDGMRSAYLPFAAQMADALHRSTAEYLIDQARFEVLGYSRRRGALAGCWGRRPISGFGISSTVANVPERRAAPSNWSYSGIFMSVVFFRRASTHSRFSSSRCQ
jgi:hypothetical protein